MKTSINNIQEFKSYCESKGSLISVEETTEGYYASFSNKVTYADGFTNNANSRSKNEYRIRLSKKDFDNELILK